MIVVIPDDPTKKSFWRGAYGDMVLKDLIPYVDGKYRTIDDERYRFTSGCSMGGAGSVGLGLFHPNLFSGVVSFYGALNYTSALNDAPKMTKEYLDMYAIYMACGNQDMYNFYDVQEQMSRILTEKGKEHYHLVDNGTHTSSFYLPHFIESLEYILERSYTTATSGEILSGSFEGEPKAGDDKSVSVALKLSVSDKISGYLNKVVASNFTENENPALRIPVEFRVVQDGKVVGKTTTYQTADAAADIDIAAVIPTEGFDPKAEYEVSAYGSALENTVLLASSFVTQRKLFDDVKDPKHPFFEAIYWAADKEITKGYPGTNLFGIDDACTRGQAMMFLWRVAGKPAPKYQKTSPFKDVPKGHTYYRAILWASQELITKGYSDGTFGIDKECTRGHIVTFIWRYKGSPAPKSTKSPFKDKLTPAYRNAILWAAEQDITNGFPDKTFRDSENCTRGQIVKFLFNMTH